MQKRARTTEELRLLIGAELAALFGQDASPPVAIYAHPRDRRGRNWNVLGLLPSAVHREAIDRLRDAFDVVER